MLRFASISVHYGRPRPQERPEHWGNLMRKEAKQVVVGKSTGGAWFLNENHETRFLKSLGAMCVAFLFGAAAIYSFGQQLRRC